MARTRKGASLPSDDMDTIVRAAAEEASSAIFAESDTTGDDGDLIEFSQFGEWYTNGGFNAIAWCVLGRRLFARVPVLFRMRAQASSVSYVESYRLLIGIHVN